ncbi:HD-GYP domain-containing protein [bacterium]|nr:HD-GYP domain-containing protein [bacterium]
MASNRPRWIQVSGPAEDPAKLLSDRKGVGRLTLQIIFSVAAFILTVEAVTVSLAVRQRARDLEKMRERMYGTAITRHVRQPEDLMTEAEMQAELSGFKRRMIISVFALLAVVLAGTALIIQKRVARPIRKMLDYNDDSLHGQIRFIPEEEYPPNELGTLMLSRNLMLYSLLQAYKKEAIDSLVSAVDAKDRYTYGHSRRVGHYGALIARAMGLSQDEQDVIRQAGDLHDIGKIAIPEEILNAPRALTNEEWEIMKKHPRRGEAMLRFTTFHPDVRLGALTHHENFDGSGYPDKLKEDDIPRVGRILHVADALDAMTSTRPYRKPLSIDSVVDELLRHKGRMFDPKVVDALLRLIERGKIKIPHTAFDHPAAGVGDAGTWGLGAADPADTA